MVSSKNRPCIDCCCSDCGARPPKDVREECCYCLCDELCVTITAQEVTGTGSDTDCTCRGCSCWKAYGVLTWSSATCTYTGTVSCGLVSIPITATPVVCDAGCFLCIDSACLNVNGDCSGTGTGTSDYCFALSCGNYKKKGCSQTGGPIISFQADISGCGDLNCTNATVDISCTSFVPATVETGTGTGSPVTTCKDCNCICECLCITYEENGCSILRKACWSGHGWTVTFNDNGCAWATQTATIEFVRMSDGCCGLNLTTTRGTVLNPEQAVSCPRPTNSWTIQDAHTGTGSPDATLTIECAVCDQCSQHLGCCDTEDDEIPQRIYAKVCDGLACDDTCIPLDLWYITDTTTAWRGTGTWLCENADYPYGPQCYESTVDIEFVCVDTGTTGAQDLLIYCNGSLQYEFDVLDEVEQSCQPICFRWTANVQSCDGYCNADITVRIARECYP